MSPLKTITLLWRSSIWLSTGPSRLKTWPHAVWPESRGVVWQQHPWAKGSDFYCPGSGCPQYIRNLHGKWPTVLASLSPLANFAGGWNRSCKWGRKTLLGYIILLKWTVAESQPRSGRVWNTGERAVDPLSEYIWAILHIYMQYWGLNQGLMLARKVLCLFVLVIFEIGSCFLPELAWTVNFLHLCFPCSWDDRHAPLCPAIGWDGASNFLPGLTLDLNPPHLHLQGSWDYKSRPPVPGQVFYFKDVWFIFLVIVAYGLVLYLRKDLSLCFLFRVYNYSSDI
jgi:hypothetical protein